MREAKPHESFADARSVSNSARSGAGAATQTPLQIRHLCGDIDNALHGWIHDRLGRQLAKFASHIERIQVRFDDVNAKKGGVDQSCHVHISVSALPPISVEVVAESEREAFDLAARSAERALRRSLQQHGFAAKHSARSEHGAAPAAQRDSTTRSREDEVESPSTRDGVPLDTGDSFYGRREGRGEPALEAVQAYAHGELASADQTEDEIHTAARNARQSTAGMAYDLEDSMTGRPSRKSSRRGKNHVKPAAGLELRETHRTHSPSSRAARNVSKG